MKGGTWGNKGGGAIMPAQGGMRDALQRGRQMARKGFEKAKRKNQLGNFDAPSLDRVVTPEEIRDTLGFAVRPQHLERYREYANVYREEERERDIKWKQFLNTYHSFGDVDGNSPDDEFDEEDWNWGGLCAVELALRAKGEVENGDVFVHELTKNVRSGVPAALRGELWQVFSGAKERWVEGQYQELLANREVKVVKPVLEKWASQIEKDLPRTFPGNPKLGSDRLDSLRRILTAYARHNPEVGYCQAMNFLAALLLLLMPEENAFWTLTSIIDDYFGGYYTERMTEAQVDQLVFADVVREHFPKLASHLDTVEVEISWFSGAWFLSIFVNVLPWESVLRVWDVLLYEGNRGMLFRTALALLEKHAEALVQERDNGTVLLTLQSIGETTFDSSQLVLSACYGFPTIDEELLEGLRDRHRPEVLDALRQRSLDVRQWRSAKLDAETNGSLSAVDLPIIAVEKERSSLKLQFSGRQCSLNAINEEPSCLESQKSAPASLNIADEEEERNTSSSGQQGLSVAAVEGSIWRYQLSAPKFFVSKPVVSNQKRFFKGGTVLRNDGTDEREGVESFDLQKEVSRLRMELDRELQKREEAECRAESLKEALMEMEKSDLQFLAKIEELEGQVAHFKQALADKHEQEAATVQVLVRLEQENRKTEEARQRAVEEAEESRQIANRAMRRAAEDIEAIEKRAESMTESMLEAIGKQAAEELRAMEKRAVMAESMLEATLDFHAGTAPRTRRGVDPKLKGNEAKDGARFQNHTNSKQHTDSALEKRQNASKLEEAEKIIPNKTSILGRPFPLRDKTKVHAEYEKDEIYNRDVGESTSVSVSSNSSPALTRKVGNIQANGNPDLVKLQYFKRRL